MTVCGGTSDLGSWRSGIVIGDVERLSDRLKREEAFPLEHLCEFLRDQLDAAPEGFDIGAVGGGLERPVEIVENGEEGRQQVLVRVPDDRRDLGLTAALEVLELRGSAEELVFVLVGKPAGLLELRGEVGNGLVARFAGSRRRG